MQQQCPILGPSLIPWESSNFIKFFFRYIGLNKNMDKNLLELTNIDYFKFSLLYFTSCY